VHSPVVVTLLKRVEDGKRVELSALDDLKLFELADSLDVVEATDVRGVDEVRVLEDAREMLEDDADVWRLEDRCEVPEDDEDEARSEGLELSERVDEDASLVADRVRLIGEGVECVLIELSCDIDIDIDDDDESATEVELSAAVSHATSNSSCS
jgi:hypothetical protein